ncbi:Lrp/AsnC ligand binding domain-containing protein [Oceaniglobus trochenteri]|uniref:Lrp/AsnC ligand binding domain-containing protein n=1 Tax=Oceaniglobus trochenteri TaxID=2763260 RepID=UPI001CFFCC75|nr:Lrp/AsnC ligand binding domain-containing protein [Oceaniglobus trochenteri]
MECVFVQIRCVPGETYKVADEIVLRELHSELYSTSGEFDLLLKMYIPGDQDIGLFINDNLRTIKGIERTLTTLTFKAF